MITRPYVALVCAALQPDVDLSIFGIGVVEDNSRKFPAFG